MAGCSPEGSAPEDEKITSLYTLVSTLDGVALYPPLGPDPAAPTAALDTSLLADLSVVLEATNAAGQVSTVATFDRTTRPAIQLYAPASVYFLNVPAATYFTNPALAYRFRVLWTTNEIARSDLSSRVFEVLTSNPNLLVGVKVRVEQRPAPALASITPETAIPGADALELTVRGTSFLHDSTVRFGGDALATTYVSGTELRATVPASELAAPATRDVTVFTAPPGGGTTGARAFTIINPKPAITSVDPAGATAGSAELGITLRGAGFIAGAVAALDDVELPTTVLSNNTLVATIAARLVASAGVRALTVLNPAPAAGASDPATFTVSNPSPVLTAISPASATAGAASLTLTVTGSAFVPSSQVTFGGAPITTTYRSATLLTATVPAALLSRAGHYAVGVTSEAPGGGSSSTADLLVSNLAPAIAFLTPSTVTVGIPAFSLTVNGSSFAFGATVLVDGTPVPTNFASSVQLTATVPTALLGAIGGYRTVTVENPAPALGGSNSASLTVQNVVPTLTSVAPTSVTIGGPSATLTLDGDDFLPGAVASFEGTSLATTWVSATRLTALLPSALIVASGTRLVTVVNPAPNAGAAAGALTVNNTVPVLTVLTPASGQVDSGAFTLTMTGTAFAPAATATFAGARVYTTVLSPTVAVATIPTTAVATAGVYDVVLTNPAPGGGASNTLQYTANNLTPTLTSVAPARVLAGDAGFELTLNGSDFHAQAQAFIGGAPVPTTFVNGTRLTATVSAATIAAAATLTVHVENPAPSLGASATLTVAVDNPAPTLAAITPASATRGAADLVVTLDGTGFVGVTRASFAGTVLSTTYVSGTRVTAVVPAALLATAGTFDVTVANAAPGGGTSVARTFTVNHPAPTLTSVTPNTAVAGTPSFTLTVVGSAFANGAIVSLGGTALATTFVSATELRATVPAPSIAAAGTVNVAVSNPSPSLGASNTLPFTTTNPAPALISVTPSSATAGAASLVVTVLGSSFVPASRVYFGGTLLDTTYGSAAQLTATIPSALLAAAGVSNVTVTSPAPGGGTSAAQTFTVNNAPAVLTAVTPASVTAGAATLTVTLTGSGFVSGAQATVGGAAVATTFVSSTQLTAVIPSASLAAAGALTVLVSNPAPTLGTSNAATLTVNNAQPALTSLAPVSASAGAATFTLTVNGSSFVSGAVVSFAGTALTTTFVGSTQLTATVPSSLVAAAGTPAVTVANPAPSNGASAALTFTVNNLTPTLSTLTPSSTGAGSANVTVTIDGTSFVSGATAYWNGAALATTFVSATRLTAVVPSASLAAAGTFSITASNPAPSNGASAGLTFTVNNSAPVLSSVTPATALVGSATTVVTLSGTAFVSGATAYLNGAALATTFVSATQLTATIPSASLAAAGTFAVYVSNPAPAVASSSNLDFVVQNAAPVLTSYTPASVTVGAASTTLTITGSSFVSGALVNLGGTNLTTTFLSSTTLTAIAPASALAAAGQLDLYVSNPSPAVGRSATRTFTVNNPAAVLTSMTPASVNVGSAQLTVTLSGSSFVSGAQVTFAGINVATTFLTSSSLTAVIPAAQLATAGTYNVTVANPTPNLGASAAQTFTVNNPNPVLTSVTPASAVQGSANTTITLNGSSFVAGASATINGTAMTTTFVSSTQLTAVVSAGTLAIAGTYPIIVSNPAPATASSASVNFTVNNPVPVLTTLTPASATTNAAAFTLTVTGSSFVAGAQITFGGTALTTTFVSATQLTATVPATSVNSGGTRNVTVANPTPNAGTSAALVFTVNNPAPTLTSISPTSAGVGAAATTLTLNGTSFVSGSYATFNGTALTTTFVSAAQLTATIPSGSLASSGTFAVTVVSPTPGGGTTASINFSVTNPVPVMSSLSPSSTSAGSAAFTLTVNGSSFVTGSYIVFGATALTTTYVSSTRLTATVPATSVASSGSSNVTVVSPTPGGGTSAAQAFLVTSGSTSGTAGTSCQTIYQSGATTSGVYWIDPDGSGSIAPFQVYCNMSDAGGGWTLVMMSTAGTTFNWASTYWTNSTTLNGTTTDPASNVDMKNTAFSSLAFTEMRFCMDTTSNCLQVSRSASSAMAVFAGAYVATSFTRANFMAWDPTADSNYPQNYCNTNGFNQQCVYSRCRFGITMNQENDCGSCDSSVGFGCEQVASGAYNTSYSSGGAYWNTPYRYRGWIFVR